MQIFNEEKNTNIFKININKWIENNINVDHVRYIYNNLNDDKEIKRKFLHEFIKGIPCNSLQTQKYKCILVPQRENIESLNILQPETILVQQVNEQEIKFCFNHNTKNFIVDILYPQNSDDKKEKITPNQPNKQKDSDEKFKNIQIFDKCVINFNLSKCTDFRSDINDEKITEKITLLCNQALLINHLNYLLDDKSSENMSAIELEKKIVHKMLQIESVPFHPDKPQNKEKEEIRKTYQELISCEDTYLDKIKEALEEYKEEEVNLYKIKVNNITPQANKFNINQKTITEEEICKLIKNIEKGLDYVNEKIEKFIKKQDESDKLFKKNIKEIKEEQNKIKEDSKKIEEEIIFLKKKDDDFFKELNDRNKMLDDIKKTSDDLSKKLDDLNKRSDDMSEKLNYIKKKLKIPNTALNDNKTSNIEIKNNNQLNETNEKETICLTNNDEVNNEITPKQNYSLEINNINETPTNYDSQFISDNTTIINNNNNNNNNNEIINTKKIDSEQNQSENKFKELCKKTNELIKQLKEQLDKLSKDQSEEESPKNESENYNKNTEEKDKLINKDKTTEEKIKEIKKDIADLKNIDENTTLNEIENTTKSVKTCKEYFDQRKFSYNDQQVIDIIAWLIPLLNLCTLILMQYDNHKRQWYSWLFYKSPEEEKIAYDAQQTEQYLHKLEFIKSNN